MVRPTDQEMMAVEIFLSVPKRRGYATPLRLATGRDGEGKTCAKSPCCGFGGLWTIGMVPGCLVLGSGVFRAEEFCLLDCKSQIEDVVQGMGSRLVGLHIPGKSFSASRN